MACIDISLCDLLLRNMICKEKKRFWIFHKQFLNNFVQSIFIKTIMCSPFKIVGNVLTDLFLFKLFCGGYLAKTKTKLANWWKFFCSYGLIESMKHRKKCIVFLTFMFCVVNFVAIKFIQGSIGIDN